MYIQFLSQQLLTYHHHLNLIVVADVVTRSTLYIHYLGQPPPPTLYVQGKREFERTETTQKIFFGWRKYIFSLSVCL